MPKAFPIRVTWRNEDDRPRSKGFDILPRAQRFAADLDELGFAPKVWVQGELFDDLKPEPPKAYSQSDEIPY